MIEAHALWIAKLRNVVELHVVEVAAKLLLICRDLAGPLDRVLQARVKADLEFGPYITDVEAIVPDASPAHDPEYLGRTQLTALADFLDAALGDEDFVLRARDAATALDNRRGAHFFAWFAGQRLLRRADDPLPVPPAEVATEELGVTSGLPPPPDGLSVPTRLGVPLDGTKHLRLCPRDLGKLWIELDARRHGVVDAHFALPDAVWAAVIPSCDVLEDLTYDEIDRPNTPPGFYQVRPKDERTENYRARLKAGLAIAAAAGASMVVLPELCTDAGLEADIVAWFAATPAVKVVIAGSRHLEQHEPRRNRARVLLRGLRPDDHLFHDKFSNFSIKLAGVLREERIERPNKVTIIAGRRWSFSPLICKDFMEPEPRHILEKLRVSVVLVPSMSPKTDLYVTSASAVAQHAQALVFVANAPHGPDDHTAILAQPRRGQPVECREQAPEGLVALIQTKGFKFRTVGITV